MKTETTPVYEGIPVFLRYSSINAELSRHAEEKKAVELAVEHGWRHALQIVYDPGMVAYSTDANRSKFLDLLPFAKSMNALEIGVGFGQLTADIASRVKQLDVLEVRLLNALFAKIRCAQLGVTNVTFTCGGDDCLLPFPDSHYHAVVLNLVLEWCASNNPDEAAVVGQRQLLSEIRRVLKPNGFVQINTKNRFSYRLLTGGRDEHMHQMRFGSSLPRAVSGLILRVCKKPRALGYLHSYIGLKRLIRSAGLSPDQSYWAVPEMRFPSQFVSTDVKSIRMARRALDRQGDTWTADLLMRVTPAVLVRHFTPGLFFIARKN